MRKTISKAAVAAVAALSLGAALMASTEPAAAQFRHGFGGWGGWHGGWGGWGWRGGYWNGCRWGGCGWGWWPFAAGAGLALAATYPYYGGYGYPYYGGYGYPYGNGCIQLQPVYSRHGRYLGRRWVNVCY